jgi:hypothetical protein
MLPLIAAAVVVVALAGVASAASQTTGNDWPHDDSAKGQQ